MRGLLVFRRRMGSWRAMFAVAGDDFFVCRDFGGDGEHGLPAAEKFEINFGEQLRIEQRAVQFAS